MNSNSPVTLVPTYYGFIESTYDALVLFEACLTGVIAHVPRRPHDREREQVIKSGNIFIYEESTSGIKRWTDGISWSPSRILGNFLIYRQLQKQFGPGEKKKALKKPKGSNGVGKSGSHNNNSGSRAKNNLLQAYNHPNASSSAYGEAGKMNPDVERALIGSLVDSYDFMDDGLVKKTISVLVNGITHHLVSYYTLADAAARRFNVPTKDPKFQNIIPRSALLTKQSFRGPVDEVDPLDRMVYGRNRYDMTNQSMIGASSLPYMPSPHSDHGAGYHHRSISYTGGYAVPTMSSYEAAATTYSTAPLYNVQYAPASGLYPTQTFSPTETAYSSHRFSVVSSGSSDGARASVPQHDRRYHHQSSDSNVSIASGWQSNGDVSASGHYSRPRGSPGHHHSSSTSSINAPPLQRGLPSLAAQSPDTFRSIAPTFDQKPLMTTSHYDLGIDSKAAMWQLGGSTGVTHPQYQQAWSATAGH